MPSPVTIWTAYGGDDRPAGLTVSSTLVVDGDPGRVLGVLDEESDVYEAAQSSGRFAMQLLRDGDDQLADRFAGLLPAPGGLFADGQWERTEFGPVRLGLRNWVGCVVAETRRVGWGLLVEATVLRVELADDDVPPLVHYRGRYVRGGSTNG
jgi:3-hydroxy-9,10-secoandrosta-1,3,5(10)-triene-9,17-dione monooxygenase reductase component